jgi:hypothetical protein
MIAVEHLNEIQLACTNAAPMTEGGRDYISLPALKLPDGCNPSVVEALICISEHSGYPTRLFLSQQIGGRGANWSTHVIFGKTWHTWSWNYVPGTLRPMEILAEHLRGLR